MIIDARSEEEGHELQTAVCVVGGGVAGITLALEFERRGIDTIVLESGGYGPDAETMDLCRGENVGIPYEFADGFRNRFLGGDSNGWGGWCRPLESHDLEQRNWVPDSGWPFGIDELQPYYALAHRVLHLGPVNFEMDHWVSSINRPDVRRIPLRSGRVIDGISQFSLPTRFGKHYRSALKKAKHVRVYLYANVVDIETESSGQTVCRVLAKTLSGRSMSVKARQVVLAAGGIENPRLLLAFNRNHATGLGNANDLVGRYFMDHPRLMLGKIRFHPQWLRNKLYDAKYHYLNRSVSVNGTCVASQFTIAPEIQYSERLLNARMWLSSIFPGEGTAAAEALVRMKLRLHGKVDSNHSFLNDLSVMIKQPSNTLNFIAARQLRPIPFLKEMQFQLITEAQFQMICEPVPDPDSCVTLANDRDRLGIPRVRVNWRLNDQVKRTFDRSLEILADEFTSAGVGVVEPTDPLLGREWPANLKGTWHYMGTTRMHDSPKRGVVDRNCRIHGMSNIYIAGSSVFPTAGANFPTFTLVALSLRLSGHIAKQLQTADASI
jgi:choline dehydrogenase-like flavoprotein